MANVHRTIIVPAAMIDISKKLSSYVDVRGEGMFTTALSPTGNPPATHYVSSGVVDEQFATIMENGDMLDAVAVQGATKQGKVKDTTKKNAQDLVALSIVHKGTKKDIEGNDVAEGPHELFAQLNLKIVNPVT